MVAGLEEGVHGDEDALFGGQRENGLAANRLVEGGDFRAQGGQAERFGVTQTQRLPARLAIGVSQGKQFLH